MRVMGGTLWVMTRRFYKRALFDKYHTFASPGEGRVGTADGRAQGRVGCARVGGIVRACERLRCSLQSSASGE